VTGNLFLGFTCGFGYFYFQVLLPFIVFFIAILHGVFFYQFGEYWIEYIKYLVLSLLAF
jgi:hypothetical protein